MYLWPEYNPTQIPGALVETRTGPFGLFRHRGMRMPPNPFTGERPIRHLPKKGGIVESSEWEFSQGRPILPYAVPLTPQAGAAGIQRMRSVNGVRWALLDANCQHVTNWAALGEARSDQLEGVVAFGIAAIICGISAN